MSSYLGNIDAERVNPANTVDVISVQTGILQYNLSQDVPGGYEANVMVVKNGLVLNPEVDYAIDFSSTTQSNTLITFNVAITTSDQIFVVHRGSATYNLVPSPKSVTEESLADNLRDLVFETFTGTGSQQNFVLTKQEFQPRSLLVSLNGLMKQPYISIAQPGDYNLTQDITNTIATLHFNVAPGAGVVIGVLHLAFSTVLRRSDYLTSILLARNTIQTVHINDDAVTGTKILLGNNDPIRATRSDTGTNNLVKLNASNQAAINDAIVVDSTQISPIADSTVDLGESANKFKDLHLSEDASIGRDLTVGRNATVTGNLTIDGSLNVSSLIGTAPVGSIVMFPTSATPAKYLVCDGSSFSPVTYPDLFALLGSSTLPDFRQRVPVGLRGSILPAGIADSLGQTGGSLVHGHTIPDHSHSLTSSNITIVDSGHAHSAGSLSVVVPSHYHTIPTHSHSLPTHYHNFNAFHMHNISTDTFSEADHAHLVAYNGTATKAYASGSGARQLTGGSGDGSVNTSYAGGFSHSHSGATTQIGGSGAPNWGNSSAQAMTSGGYYGSQQFSSTDASGVLNTDSITAATVAVSNSTSLSNADSTIQSGSRTETFSGLLANNNNPNSQPYLTVNFIIRALA